MRPEPAKIIDLGVKHFSLGDEMAVLLQYWENEGGKMKAIAQKLEQLK